MAKSNEFNGNVINLIGAGTEIKGNIKSNGDIRIDGFLNGNLNTKGKVVIGESGRIKGEIFCTSSDIEGTIEGKVNVGELLTLKSSAKVIGDIKTGRLAIEPGSAFTGSCIMTENAIKNEGGKGLKLNQKATEVTDAKAASL
jgi:cytoskeletal protein CcmA (bactofilin family)